MAFPLQRAQSGWAEQTPAAIDSGESQLHPAAVGDHRPMVSIGVPVWNGENYLTTALDSLLSQTFTDFEVVISDNASSDRTQEIGMAYAARDRRVRYIRQPTNLGAAPNYNAVFRQGRGGPYFMWLAHDDVLEPAFLERCVAALEGHPERVVAYTLHHTIDSDGSQIATSGATPGLGSEDPSVRVATALSPKCDGVPPWAIFGVMRRDVLENTRLHGSYTGSDRTLVVEMALAGELYEVDEHLLLNREHEARSIRIYRGKKAKGHVREAWFDTKRAGRIVLPNWKRLGEISSSILRTPMPLGVKYRSLIEVYRWQRDRNWKRLVRDLREAAYMILDRTRRPSTDDA